MNTTNGARLRQSAQRLEIPDAPLSMVATQSVEAACHKYLPERDDIQVDEQLFRKARGNKTKEAAERCAESGTFPTRSHSDGQVYL